MKDKLSKEKEDSGVHLLLALIVFFSWGFENFKYGEFSVVSTAIVFGIEIVILFSWIDFRDREKQGILQRILTYIGILISSGAVAFVFINAIQLLIENGFFEKVPDPFLTF